MGEVSHARHLHPNAPRKFLGAAFTGNFTGGTLERYCSAASLLAEIFANIPADHSLLRAHQGRWKILKQPEFWQVALQMETLRSYQHVERKKSDPRARRDDENIRTFLSIVPTIL